MRVLFATALAAAGVALGVSIWWNTMDVIAAGKNDFAMLYAGATLAGKADLYHAPSVMRVKAEAAGEYGQARQYTRLPYLAALLWPFGQLPYLWAYAAFQAVSLAALSAFVVLWPQNRAVALMACCWSVPVSAAFALGQDVVFLMVCVALALRWHKPRPLAAGLALALCAAKFHLFIHVPLVIAAQRRWRAASGILLGGAGITALSFAVADADWPVRYLATISSPSIGPGEHIMPNLHGLLRELPGRAICEVLLAVTCGLLVWIVARRGTFDLGIAAALIAGVLTSVHAYLPDCVLLIPAALVLFGTRVPWMRMAAAAILLPFPYLFLHAGSPAGRVVPAILLLLLCAMAWPTHSNPDKPSLHGAQL